ncbi:hypothetical protein [Marinomonas posidonica]|uniref:hypothetical protein n=1 Tax=Marinomonas posidonica TaxID=936476 RepID=UPI0037367A30
MGLTINIINFLVLIIPPIGIWLYLRPKRKKILARHVTTRTEKAHQNLDLRDWSNHSTQLFAKCLFPIIITTNLISIWTTMMDTKEQDIINLKSQISTLAENHHDRIKFIEEYLFPPEGPTGPTIFQRMDSMEKSRDDLETLMLRVTNPNPELNRQMENLKQEIISLREEMDSLKLRLGRSQQSGYSSSSM